MGSIASKMRDDTWGHVQCRDTCIHHAQRDSSVHDGCIRRDGWVFVKGLTTGTCMQPSLFPLALHGPMAGRVKMHGERAWGWVEL